MIEKRKFPRYDCKIKNKFDYYEGNPAEFDAQKSRGKKGKGIILDVSRGGIFIITNEKVSVGLPIRASFEIKKQKLIISGTIVRTGLLKNNPSELARRFAGSSSLKEAYIAVEFNEPMDMSVNLQ